MEYKYNAAYATRDRVALTLAHHLITRGTAQLTGLWSLKSYNTMNMYLPFPLPLKLSLCPRNGPSTGRHTVNGEKPIMCHEMTLILFI